MRWGEIQGVVFQIIDDQLDLLADEGVTGKPAGTDIVSDKQTLHRKLLFQRAPAESRKRLESIFGSPELSPDDLDFVRKLLQSSGVLSKIASRINDLSTQAARLEAEFETVTDEGRRLLRTIARYNLERTQ
jgi:geranylgeranyl pyrophosphate synthase